MAGSPHHGAIDAAELTRALDEAEQLRTALEAALEENAALVQERDRSVARLTQQSRELQAVDAAYQRAMREYSASAEQVDLKRANIDETSEELRVAFEELQVLTEELEAANDALRENNHMLDQRVEERTTELASTNATLRDAERRFRTLIEGIPQLVWRAEYGGDWTWASPQWCAFTGLSFGESLGDGWLRAIHPNDRAESRRAWRDASAEAPLEIEARICEAQSGRYRHFRTRATAVQDDEGRVVEWLGTSTDVDDIIKLQAEQEILVAELQHRTRNLMAVIQAVMRRTLKDAGSLGEFREGFEDRLQALSRVQGLLSRRKAGLRIPFDVILREELSVHAELDDDGNGAQITTHGPEGVPLRSSLVQTLAFALHELATNAVKYGALATPDGHLAVEWRVEHDGASTPFLHVDWREHGVAMPPVDGTPRGGGYGRELIERALPYQLGARTTYELAPEGVHCTIEVAVPVDEKKPAEMSYG